jgi:glycosyltransferase involved in cell wall biosynthesis
MQESSEKMQNASQSKLDISVVILTYNEEIHIQRCLANVVPWAREVFVVDSFSTDRTIEIAKQHGALVYQNKWEGLYARQFNWALDNLPINTEWVLRLDADEYLYPELIKEITKKLQNVADDITGVVFKRRHIFLDKWVRRGTYPVKLLRLFRTNKARCEQRLMDEHIELFKGRSIEFDGDFADHNLNDIGWWTSKHNGYALREAVDLLDLEYRLLERRLELGDKRSEGNLSKQAVAKRLKKLRYAKSPLFFRAFAYFVMRYFLMGGFLEGKEGFLWHFLQGWWYRTLVDAKVSEIKRESGGDREKMLELLRGKYGMKI